MGGGSVLSLRVTSEQSNGLVTVLEGIVESGGPPLHVHLAEDEVVVVLNGELTYRGVEPVRLALSAGTPLDPAAMSAVAGADRRPVVGPPL